MQVISKNTTQHRWDTVALTTGNDYIKIFSIPCRTGCTFSLSSKIPSHDWAISGTLTSGWDRAAITGTLSQHDSGTNGVYALRAFQASPGSDLDLWLAFGGNVSGLMELDITVTPANYTDDITFHNLVRSGATSGTQRATIEYYTSGVHNAFGTSASKM